MNAIGPVNAVQQKTLVQVIAAIHEVPAERFPALRGRLRNFLKLGLPNITAVGTGSRAEYWPSHVAQALVGFELVRLRMPQTAAAHCVLSSLDAVERVFGDAARVLAGGEIRPSAILTVTSNGLLDDAKQPEWADLSMSACEEEPSVTLGAAGSILAIAPGPLIERAARAAQGTDEPFGVRFFTELGSR